MPNNDEQKLSAGEFGAWGPIDQFLPKLIESADILLHHHDYDGHGWEEHEYAWRAAKVWTAERDTRLQDLHDELTALKTENARLTATLENFPMVDEGNAEETKC